MVTAVLMFLSSMASEAILFIMFHTSAHLPVNRKKIILAATVISLVSFPLISPINEFCRLLTSVFRVSNIAVINICNALLNLPALYFFDPKHIKTGIFHGAICYYIWQALLFLISAFITLFPSMMNDATLSYLFILLITYPFCKAAQYLIRKLRPYEFSQYLHIQEQPFWKSALISMGILFSTFLIDTLHFTDTAFFYFLWMGIMLLALSSVMLRFTSDYVHHQEKEQWNELIISQQNLYIQDLEDLQKEVRLFRHDYTNILSGIYLHSQHGDGKQLQHSVQNLLNEFDEGIGGKMNLTLQLANLHLMELKSLIIQKLTQIHQLPAHVTLEVLYPVESVSMNLQDLIRCLGILLDNAIEEAGNYKEGYIILSILQEEDLTIVVENTVHHTMEIESIWEEGYSTKGKNRGIGLVSYLHIIGQYKNVTSAATYKNGRFIQELRIGVKT